MRKGILYSAVLGAMFISGQARAIDFDGFLTAGFAVHNMDEMLQTYDTDIPDTDSAPGPFAQALVPATYLNSIEDDASFDNDSKFGLQVTADVFNNMQAVAQILATGADENYDLDVEWAYLDYAVSNSINLRGGKVKEPVFLISDYYEVGYAYPWIRPPEEVYGNNPINTIVGMQALFTTNFGGTSLIVQPYLGSNSEAVPGTGGAVNFDATNFYGLAIQLSSASFTFQVSSLKTDVSTVGFLTMAGPAPGTLGAPPSPGNIFVINASATGTAELSSAGFSFDIANFIGYAEYVTRDIEGSVEGLFPDQDGYYVTFGYRAGKFLPHITVASVEADLKPTATPANGANQGNTQDSVTVGLRYEVNDAAAFKFEVKSIELDPTTASNGFFSADVPGAFYTNDKATVVSVALDVIF